jgi:pilus assembly protein Flp/PilA
MIRRFRRFMKGRRGQGMSEYIIMVGLVAIAAIGVYTAFGDQVRAAMNAIGTQLSGDETASQTLDSGLQQQADKAVTLSDFGGNNQ